MPVRLLSAFTLLFFLSACARFHTTVLSNDNWGGRDNESPGSIAAQNYLIGLMSDEGATGPNTAAVGADAYKQAFPRGTNILGVIPGTDLAHEYVMVGAHYDHLSSCFQASPGDTVCNGATDNAAGVAAVLDIGLHFSLEGRAPRRSVILAFWDREEDGLLGSAHYVNNPLVPLSSTVAYINFDILGANLLPSLRGISIAVGAESGGAALVDAVAAASAQEPLDVKQFSAIFGQNRSDYANFIAAGVPTVFFTDSTGPCYHTTGDDMSVVDFDKLYQQVRIARDLAAALAAGQVTPSFVGGAPLGTFGDAVSLNGLLQLALPDIGRFSPTDQSLILAHANTMSTMVAAGEGAFDAADVTSMLLVALDVVSLLATGECDGFLAG